MPLIAMGREQFARALNERADSMSERHTHPLRRILMKLLAALVGIAVISATATSVKAQTSQPKPYKVVFDLTSSDPIDQQAVIRWINEVKAVNPGTETEVVMYGRGLDLVIADKTTRAADVAKAITDLHAIFRVCAIAMKNQQLDKSRLLPNVEIVPDGIGEIVARQGAGWGYIKVGH
jgi:intracellular sulfur oxidation DsrE/DsrF family protein